MTDREHKFGQKTSDARRTSTLKRSLTSNSSTQRKLNVVSTELLVEKMLAFDPVNDDEIDQWNMMDEEQVGDGNISYLKMMNEMLKQEARYINEKGENVQYSVWSANMGRHSSSKEKRKGELD